MSEIGHHPSILALHHVQSLRHRPQDVEAAIPVNTAERAQTSNSKDENKAEKNKKEREQNSPFDLRHLPAFEEEGREEITVKARFSAISLVKLCDKLTCP